MIHVTERYWLKSEYAADAARIMKELDDILGPAAHENEGWVEHASFLQDRLHRHQVAIVYRWLNAESFWELVHDEEPRLVQFYKKYCAKPREISMFEELDVEV